MNRKTVNAAMISARRFLRDAEWLLGDEGFDIDYTKNKLAMSLSSPNAKSGAVRRASMDLTRDLAAMRKRTSE